MSDRLSEFPPPIGPSEGSLLHRYLADRRFLLALPRAVGLQILHPTIAAALVEHVPYRLWHHKRRTVTRMIALAYRPRHPSHTIRFAHEHVKGRDDRGERYHALNPEVFHFQHATYVETLVTAINTFATPLSGTELDQLYRECCDWYRIYGVSTRHMPATWPEFTDWFADTCATSLRLTSDGAALASQALRPDAWIPSLTPGFAVRSLHHERTRALLDIEVGPLDRAAMRIYASAIRLGMSSRPPRRAMVRR
ncbi:DUF2236 domain-containing protein [Nocardia sp. 2]|uniref:DUF2236 domain-containing protein n=1 Tax=Nocardia acididurans TaxID=2802282 RepID=A0ABS1M4V5_9NOCA|nr:oxygenase MpaB family protein [Nocardia acididurans]MBL1074168.1 DUF2236 domain-containing protein [Nocardia acididurans]